VGNYYTITMIPFSQSERMRASVLGFLAEAYNNIPNQEQPQVYLPYSRPQPAGLSATTPSAWTVRIAHFVMMAAPEWEELDR
jgi:hypothetical protein